MVETFLCAIYNEEILDKDVAGFEKQVEQVRVPSLRYPSVYHDPKRLNVGPEILQLRAGTSAYVQMTVHIGPYETVEEMNAENRHTILTRLLKSVNSCLRCLPEDVVCRYLCSSTHAICHSGFSFGESDFVSRIFNNTSIGFMEDFSRKPRIRLSSHYLLEALNGVYFALFNGNFEIKALALRVIDAIHQRAIYELFADVTLVTNSVRSSLLEKSIFQNEEIAAIKRSSFAAVGGRKRGDLVTNASLRLKKMPEDIVVISDEEVLSPHKKESLFSEGVEGFKKKLVQKIEQSKAKSESWLEQQKARSESFLHHTRRRKNTHTDSSGANSDLELTQIAEESKETDAVIDELAETLSKEDSDYFKHLLHEKLASSNANGDAKCMSSESLHSEKDSGAVTSGQSLRHMDSLIDALENAPF